MLTEIGSTPHGDQSERLIIGQIQPLHAQNVVGTEHGPYLSAGFLEGELEDAPFRANATVDQLRLDGGQSAETLTQRCGGHEPTETLTRINEAFVAQGFESPPHGDATGLELGTKIALRRQQTSRGVRTIVHPSAQLVGDDPIPDFSGSGPAHTCIILVS
jgi:hypothetical protein